MNARWSFPGLLLFGAALMMSGCAKPRTVAAPPPPPVPTISAPVTAIHVVHIGPAKLYPNQAITPGAAGTLSIADLTARYTDHCPSGKTDCTYSQSHRNVPGSVHKKVYDSYKVSPDKRNIQNGEVDHLYPMCAGGSNDEKNLWYQPAENKWKGKNFGFHEKDHLETHVCSEIKARRLDPATAFRKLTDDWVAYYLELKLDSQTDGPDEDID